MTSPSAICSSCGKNGGGFKFCVLCGAPQISAKGHQSMNSNRPVKQDSAPKISQTLRGTSNTKDDSVENTSSSKQRSRTRTASDSDIKGSKSPMKTIGTPLLPFHILECGKCKKPFTANAAFIQSQGKYFHKVYPLVIH